MKKVVIRSLLTCFGALLILNAVMYFVGGSLAIEENQGNQLWNDLSIMITFSFLPFLIGFWFIFMGFTGRYVLPFGLGDAIGRRPYLSLSIGQVVSTVLFAIVCDLGKTILSTIILCVWGLFNIPGLIVSLPFFVIYKFVDGESMGFVLEFSVFALGIPLVSGLIMNYLICKYRKNRKRNAV